MIRIKKKIKPPNVLSKYPPHPFCDIDSAVITGGIGDVFAIESFLPQSVRKNLTTIYYAANKSESIKTCLRTLPNYNIQNHIDVWTDFSNFWCFFSKEEVANKLKEPVEGFEESRDFSIGTFFPSVSNGDVMYTGSSFLQYKLTDVSSFQLPKRFITVCPYSSDKREKGRDFSSSDWRNLLDYLSAHELHGVVLSDTVDDVPESPFIINLSNRTSIIQAIEILKSSCGYIGIDSSISVLASKLFIPRNLLIKCRNWFCYTYSPIYYAPQAMTAFMVGDVCCDHLTIHRNN